MSGRLAKRHQRLCIGQLHYQAALFVANAVETFGLSRDPDDVTSTIASVCIALCEIEVAKRRLEKSKVKP